MPRACSSACSWASRTTARSAEYPPDPAGADGAGERCWAEAGRASQTTTTSSSSVAQSCTLLYRRVALGRAPQKEEHPVPVTPGRIQFCDTAEYNSALRGTLRKILVFI